jgi:transposase
MVYPIEYRRKVLQIMRERKLSIREAAATFQVGTTSLVRWLKCVERKPSGPRRRKIDKARLVQDVAEYPDAYQYERAARFGVSSTAIWKALKQLRISYKKNSAPSESR